MSGSRAVCTWSGVRSLVPETETVLTASSGEKMAAARIPATTEATVHAVMMMFRFSRLPLGSGKGSTFATAAAPLGWFSLGRFSVGHVTLGRLPPEVLSLDLPFVGAGSAAGALLDAEMISGSVAGPGVRLPEEVPDPPLPRRARPGEV